MIVRLVTMTFKSNNIDDFLGVFDIYKHKIKAAEGCLDLQLIQNSTNPNEISTLSKWNSEEELNAYRNSETFKTVWPLTKVLFSAKPKAITFNQLIDV